MARQYGAGISRRPFSAFTGVDRTLRILDGNRIDLAVDGAAPVRIDTESIHASRATARPLRR